MVRHTPRTRECSSIRRATAYHCSYYVRVDTLYKLKSNSNNFVASVYSIFLNANNVSSDFQALLEDVAAPNEHQPLAKEFRAAHSRLSADKQQQIANELNDKVIAPIDAELKTYQMLQTRIARRDEMHNDLEYYLNVSPARCTCCVME